MVAVERRALRDSSCRICDCLSSHLCPQGEIAWFMRNRMQWYNLQTQPTGVFFIDDVLNAISLRHDLHRDFVEFVCVPKSTQAMFVHVLQPTHELGRLYHDVQTDP